MVFPLIFQECRKVTVWGPYKKALREVGGDGRSRGYEKSLS